MRVPTTSKEVEGSHKSFDKYLGNSPLKQDILSWHNSDRNRNSFESKKLSYCMNFLAHGGVSKIGLSLSTVVVKLYLPSIL